MEEIIKLLVDRVSQYGFLVNLIPGTALCLLLEWIGYDIIPAEGFYISHLFHMKNLLKQKEKIVRSQH